MNQKERLDYLVEQFKEDSVQYRDLETPADTVGKKRILRSLMNIRMPKILPSSVLAVQDEYLQTELKEKGITVLADLLPFEPGLYLWQGDITTLSCDAIVNAANSGMTGCPGTFHLY